MFLAGFSSSLVKFWWIFGCRIRYKSAWVKVFEIDANLFDLRRERWSFFLI